MEKKKWYIRFKDWLIKPKSLNATAFWIFTLAAIVPIAAWLILGESGVNVGGFLGGGFMMCGVLVSLMGMD